jgi:predicted dehydrogenase
MAIQPVEAVLLGAGMRGYCTFGGYTKAYPHNLKIIGVAELDAVRRERFARDYAVPQENVFASWEDLLARPQLAAVLINATMDRSHFDSTMTALDQGYHVLLEKPMATDPISCIRLARKVKETGKVLQLCHSLRYNPFYTTLNMILHSDDIGELISVEHNEHIAFWHYAHSFVRGNWSNESRSSPGLLSKSCHDVDILYWLAGALPKKVTSFGSLRHFRPDRVNDSIPPRCTDGCPIEPTCPYSTIPFYLNDKTDWPVNTISSDLSYEGRLKALREGPYGRCVYRCDNDVVDHQMTLFEFENGLTIGFQMHGHSHNNIRTMRYSASRATIRGYLEKRELEVNYYLEKRTDTIFTGGLDDMHGGGDTLMIHDFIDLVRKGKPEKVTASAQESCNSHLLVFAAETARKENRVVDVAAYFNQIESTAQQD